MTGRFMKLLKRQLAGGVLFLLLSVSVLQLIAKQNGYETAVIASNSMAPELRTGDLIMSSPADISAIRKDMIVTYHLAGTQTAVTHRVIRKDEEKQELYTKGDANNVEDPIPVTQENLTGVMLYKIHYLGYLFLVIRTVKEAAVLLLLLLTAIFVLRKVLKKTEILTKVRRVIG